jgi:hypothetical protein
MKLKTLLAPLLLTFSLNSVVFAAAGGYKCTAKQAYGITDDGFLQNNKEESPNYWIVSNPKEKTGWKFKDFTIDKETGRFLGGSFPLRGKKETFTIISKGGESSSFKAYYVEAWAGWLLSIEIKEYADSYKKPFLYTTIPNSMIFTGTCINY